MTHKHTPWLWHNSQYPPLTKSLMPVSSSTRTDLMARVLDLRFACTGRLVGHVAEDRDALDVADFELAAVRLLGAEAQVTLTGNAAHPT